MVDDLSQAHVLVADDSSTVRQSVRMTLSQLGILRVDAANSIGEARRRIRNGEYDVILCDYHFGEGMNGQELLEELRRSGELPLATIWIMITAEAAYEKVVSVAEIGPDDYLIKPFTSALLGNRLYTAWLRKKFLSPIFTQIDAGQTEAAITAAIELLPTAEKFRNDVLRLLCNLLVEAGKLDQAKAYFEEILTQRVVPWAKLGLAKVFSRQGNQSEAERILTSAIEAHGHYVDAYEELAGLYMSTGKTEQAMAIFDRCLAITPNNVSRLQQAGNLASMMGDSARAKQLLEKAVICGGNSSALNPETVLQLALASKRQNDLGDAERYLRMALNITKRDESHRNRIVYLMANALHQNKAEGLNEVTHFFLDMAFTQEIAGTFIMTADLLCPPSLEGEEGHSGNPPYSWLYRIARRFVTTRHISSMLEGACGMRQAWREYIQRVGAEITELNNQGVQLMLKSRLEEGLALLLTTARETCNNRLMLSATHAIIKHLKGNREISTHERKEQLKTADIFIERLRGSVEDAVLRNLHQELDELLHR